MRLRDADVETRSAAKYLSTDVPINKVDGPQEHYLRSINRSRASLCSQLSLRGTTLAEARASMCGHDVRTESYNASQHCMPSKLGSMALA